MLLNRIIGITAGIGTTVSFAPQVYQIAKYKKTENISPVMFCIHTTGVGLWIVYGILQDNYIIIAFNSIAFIFCSYILLCIILFHQARTQES